MREKALSYLKDFLILLNSMKGKRIKVMMFYKGWGTVRNVEKELACLWIWTDKPYRTENYNITNWCRAYPGEIKEIEQ